MYRKVLPAQQASSVLNDLPIQKPDPAIIEAMVNERLAQEINRIKAKAEADGYQSGVAKAEKELSVQVNLAKEACKILTDVQCQIGKPLERREAELADLVTELAFIVARHVVHEEVKTNRDSLRHLVEDLIVEASNECADPQMIVIKVCPSDADVIKSLVQEHGIRMDVDKTIEQGGAMLTIESTSGDPLNRYSWDATIASRMAAIGDKLSLPVRKAVGDSAVSPMQAVN